LLYAPIGVLVFAHIVTAILHDWKSPAAEISAMINGHKFFSVERQPPGSGGATVQLNDLLSSKPGKKS
jgi:hypothetical protein